MRNNFIVIFFDSCQRTKPLLSFLSSVGTVWSGRSLVRPATEPQILEAGSCFRILIEYSRHATFGWWTSWTAGPSISTSYWYYYKGYSAVACACCHQTIHSIIKVFLLLFCAPILICYSKLFSLASFEVLVFLSGKWMGLHLFGWWRLVSSEPQLVRPFVSLYRCWHGDFLCCRG